MNIIHIDRREQHIITAETLDLGKGTIESQVWQKSCSEEGYEGMDNVFYYFMISKTNSPYSKAKALDVIFDALNLGKSTKYQTDYVIFSDDGETVAIVNAHKVYSDAEMEKLRSLPNWAIEKGEF